MYRSFVVPPISSEDWPQLLKDAVNLKIHHELDTDMIVRISYDYGGPGTTQRKIVETTVGTFVYVEYHGNWQIVQNINVRI